MLHKMRTLDVIARQPMLVAFVVTGFDRLHEEFAFGTAARGRSLVGVVALARSGETALARRHAAHGPHHA